MVSNRNGIGSSDQGITTNMADFKRVAQLQDSMAMVRHIIQIALVDPTHFKLLNNLTRVIPGHFYNNTNAQNIKLEFSFISIQSPFGQ